MSHTHNNSICNCKSSSLSQTLDEIDFTRSIHYNCLNNQLAQVQTKLSKSPQLINSKDSYGYTPLHYAAKKGCLEICKYLVENGACVHQITNGQGTTALHRACLENHTEVIIYLIEKGADPECKDFDGRTPMSILEEKSFDNTLDLIKASYKFK